MDDAEIVLGKKTASQQSDADIVLGKQPAPIQPTPPKEEPGFFSKLGSSIMDVAGKLGADRIEAQNREAEILRANPPKLPSFTGSPITSKDYGPLEKNVLLNIFGVLPYEREGAYIAQTTKSNFSMSALKPAQAKEILSKPLPPPEYTGSKGEQLLATFAGNAAEGLIRTATFGMLGGVAPTPQGITGEVPVGIAGQITGAFPSLLLIGQGFHLVTNAIVKGLPTGIKNITEAAIKLGFTTDMLNNALNNSVNFANSVKAGDTRGMIDSGSGVLIDSLFSFLIAKGLPEDARKIADFRKNRSAGGSFFDASSTLKAAAEKKSVEPEVKKEMATTNQKIVRTKNVRTKEEPQLEPDEFDELLAPMKEDLNKLKDWSDYPKDEEVAKAVGKPVEEVTIEDTKSVVEEDLNEIDFELGKPEPVEMRNESSPFRQEKDVTKAQLNNYRRNPVVANTYEELTSTDPENYKSAAITARKLVADFNAYLDGEKVDVTKTQEMASRMAAQPNDFEWQFIDEKGRVDEEGFKEFSTYVSDAAKWMRQAQKPGLGTSLHFGLPIDEAYQMMKPWFSSLRKYAEEKLPKIASAEQILATLRKGSTKDEWENVGLEGVLEKGRKYSREEIGKIIDEGSVELKDVELSYRKDQDPSDPYDEDSFTPKFSSYVEPGGSNYKELFVTAPERTTSVDITRESFDSVRSYLSQSTRDELWNKYQSGELTPNELVPNGPSWQDGHADYSDIENPVVRLRMNDRVDSEGKKVLFLEEVQPPNPSEQEKMPAYLQKRWREIGMKRALKYAIDNGYDKVAWTTGEMQAKRYSLDQTISDIVYHDATSGGVGLPNLDAEETGGVLKIRSTDGRIIYDRYTNVEELSNIIGEEATDRLLSAKPRSVRTGSGLNSRERALTGQNLVMENKGLRKLYDQDIPNVVKKLGGEVGESNVRFKDYLKERKYVGPEHDIESLQHFIKNNRLDASDEMTIKGIIEALKQDRNFDRVMYDYGSDSVARLLGGKFVDNPSSTKVQSVSLQPLKSKASGGFSLYSGVPVDRLESLGKDLTNYYKRLSEAKSKSIAEMFREAKKIGIAHWLNQSGNARALIEAEGDKAKEVLQATALARGGHSLAIARYKQADKEVNSGLSKAEQEAKDRLIMAERVLAVNKTSPKTIKNVPKAFSVENSTDIINAIGSKKINGSEDLTPQAELLVRKAKDTYFDANRQATKDLADEGIIGRQEERDLVANNYAKFSPVTKQTIDKITGNSGVGRTSQGAFDPLKRIKKGGNDEVLLETNSRLTMLEYFDQVYTAIAINRAKRTMADFAKSTPENKFSWVDTSKVKVLDAQPSDVTGLKRSIKIKRYEQGVSDYEFRQLLKANGIKEKFSATKNITALRAVDKALGDVSKGYEKVLTHPKGWVRDYYLEDGIKKEMWLEPSFAKEWMAETKETSGAFAKFVRVFSGSQIVKLFATGINPAFAIANLPRDAVHAWFASRVMEGDKWKSLYSMRAPRAVGQMARDYKDVFVDVMKEKGVIDDFIEDGGGSNYLYTQGRLTDVNAKNRVRLEGPFDALYDFMSGINRRSEMLTRMAIRNRVIRMRAKEQGLTVEQAKKDPKIRREASFAAIDQMNFGEGGSIAKALDNAIPYLKARIVGTRSLWRVFEPGSGTAKASAVKLGQFAALVTGLYLLNRQRNPQAIDDLRDDPRSKNSFTLVMGKDAGVTVDGQKRHVFFRAPLDSGQAFFKVLFESIAGKMLGDEIDPTKIVRSLKDALPADISNLPPTAQGLIGYYTNTNIWSGNEIWKGYEGPIPYKPPQWMTGDKVGGSNLEYTKRTPEIYKDLGDLTGLSPERLGYVIQSYLTNDNLYSQLTFSMYDKIFHGLDDDQKKQLLAESISRYPGTKRFFGLTNPASQDIKKAEEINWRRIGIKAEQNQELDRLLDSYLAGGKVTGKEINEFISKQPDKADQERLAEDVKKTMSLKDLPSAGWWRKLMKMDSQGRAEAFVERYNKAKKMDERAGNTEAVDQLLSEASRFGDEGKKIRGVITDDFKQRVRILMSK